MFQRETIHLAKSAHGQGKTHNKTLDTTLDTKLEKILDSLTWHWRSMNVHAQVYFAPLKTTQFLSFCGCRPSYWAHGRSMPPSSDQVVLACVNKKKLLKNKRKKIKKINSRTVRLHVATSISVSTESLCFSWISSKHAATSASSTSLQFYRSRHLVNFGAHLLSPDYSVYYTQ